MVRAIVVMVCMAGWCVWLHAPEAVAPDPDAPLVRMPATCVPELAFAPRYDRALHDLAGKSDLTADQRAAIARDDLAALRYLIHAARRRGAQSRLPLRERSRPLLHALNDLLTWADRRRIPLAVLAWLHLHYGADLVTAVALARGQSRPDRRLAQLGGGQSTGASRSMEQVERCERIRRQPIPTACGTSTPGLNVAHTILGEQRLPRCEHRDVLADRLLRHLPRWSRDASMQADPKWRSCFEGLALQLAERREPHPEAEALGRRLDRIRRAENRLWRRPRPDWQRAAFEWALLELTPWDRAQESGPGACVCWRSSPVRGPRAPGWTPWWPPF